MSAIYNEAHLNSGIILLSEDQFFYGDSLKNSLSSFVERQYLIDSFLYEHSSILLYAADGIGKSVLTLQLVIEAASGNPVFGVLKTSRQLRTLWVMAERHPIEIFERIKEMEKVVPLSPLEFGITTELQGFNLLNESYFTKAISIIEARAKILSHIDLVVVDPIYALVAGGLSRDENDSCVTRFSTTLQNKFGCSCIFIHHSNRGVRSQENPAERVGQDMYGGRFLSAHFTGIYHITKTSDGTHFAREKSSHRNLIESFDLTYDHETYVSTLTDDSMPKRDRILIELRRLKTSGKWIELDALAGISHVSTQYLYKLFSR